MKKTPTDSLLEIVSSGFRIKGREYLECKCDCGNIKLIQKYYVVSKKTKSCGCLKFNKDGENVHNWTGFGEIGGKFFYKIKRNAQIRKIDFNVSIEEIWNLFLLQNRRCALTNLVITIPTSSRKNNPGTASLDRIDSSLPYVLSNIQWVHKDINRMKSDLQQEWFIDLCRLVVKNKDSSNHIQ